MSRYIATVAETEFAPYAAFVRRQVEERGRHSLTSLVDLERELAWCEAGGHGVSPCGLEIARRTPS